MEMERIKDLTKLDDNSLLALVPRMNGAELLALSCASWRLRNLVLQHIDEYIKDKICITDINLKYVEDLVKHFGWIAEQKCDTLIYTRITVPSYEDKQHFVNFFLTLRYALVNLTTLIIKAPFIEWRYVKDILRLVGFLPRLEAIQLHFNIDWMFYKKYYYVTDQQFENTWWHLLVGLGHAPVKIWYNISDETLREKFDDLNFRLNTDMFISMPISRVE